MTEPVRGSSRPNPRRVSDPGLPSASEIIAGRARDEMSAVEVVSGCLSAVEQLDGDVHAWTCLDHDRALGRAAALDRTPRPGALAGVPIGVKDIFDTAGLPTEFGSPIYRGRRPVRDAAVLALLRSAGVITLGKTRTTEFAFFAPGPTANPRDLDRTPGGSSSGSAAAVAAGMVPVALGSQTAGSIIRPATFCGVVGYKPTFGLVPRAGVLVFAESLDTIGIFARQVTDAQLLGPALMGRTTLPDRGGRRRTDAPPTFILCRTDEWADVDDQARRAVEAAVAAGESAGATLIERELPIPSSELVAAHNTVMAFEASRALAVEIEEHRAWLSPQLQALLDTGAQTPIEDYQVALALRDRCRSALETWWGDADALLTPASLGAAPIGLDTTGDPLVNRTWTLLGLPSVCLPTGSGTAGMPLAVQLVGRAFDDGSVLQLAHWLEQQLAA